MQLLNLTNVSSTPEHGSFRLKEISFAINEFQRTAIAGRSGAGKTTLMKIIGGLLQPASGEIIFKGKKVMGPDHQLIPGEAGTAYLSQHFELRHNYRMEELLSYANNLPADKANRIFEICQISDVMKRRSDQLSGGERQRIALARLLIGLPKLLLLDEPFSNLDLISKNILRSIIKEISNEFGITTIMTSHDPIDLLTEHEHIIVLENGEMIQSGKPEDIYLKPVNDYCALLFGPCNIFSPAEAKTIFDISTDKKIYVRPEHILVDKSNEARSGIIKESKFSGAFYKNTVRLAGIDLNVHTLRQHVSGTPVSVSLFYS